MCNVVDKAVKVLAQIKLAVSNVVVIQGFNHSQGNCRNFCLRSSLAFRIEYHSFRLKETAVQQHTGFLIQIGKCFL